MSILYSVGADRLGGRLSSMLNTLRIAADYKMVPTVLWPRRHHTYSDLDQPELIFADDWIKELFLPRRFATIGMLVGPDGPPRQLTDDINKIDKDAFMADLASNAPLSVRTVQMLVLPWEDRETVRKSYAKAMQSVQFSSQCQDILLMLDTLLTGHAVTGVHLRRGDIIRDVAISERYWQGRFIPDEFYHAALDQLVRKGQAACLFTDDDAIKQAFCARHPALETIDAHLPVTSGPIFDLAELYALSRCDTILAPTRSAFSQAASDINLRPITRIMQMLSQDEIAACAKGLYARLQQGPSAFVTHGDFRQSQLFWDRDRHMTVLHDAVNLSENQ